MRRNMRRAGNWKIEAQPTCSCKNCGAAMQSHRICPECGFYKGELILPKKVKKEKNPE
jgi:large subunit ribosomal protein L32